MKKNEMTISEMASMGGKATWAKLTPKQRSERARNAGKKGGWPKGKPRKPKYLTCTWCGVKPPQGELSEYCGQECRFAATGKRGSKNK